MSGSFLCDEKSCVLLMVPFFVQIEWFDLLINLNCPKVIMVI